MVESNRWEDEYLDRAREFIASGQIDSDVNFKLDIGESLKEVRETVLSGNSEWLALLEDIIRRNPLVYILVSTGFLGWFQDRHGNALGSLQAFWSKGDIPIDKRISAFVAKVPDIRIYAKDNYQRHIGPGSMLASVSVLLMALDPEEYPPYRWDPFKRAYERTGYPFSSGDDEAVFYEHAMTFLDQLVRRASERGFSRPCNRLEAQAVVWWREMKTGSESEEGLPQLPNLRLQALADKILFNVGFLQEIDLSLTDNKQVIFQGPPGTGKTYVAQAVAKHLAGSKDRVTLVQFHPSYAYEDFVQGFRPTLVNGQPGFELMDGPLLRAARHAREEPDAKHFLVIDEINRSNVAKVFGELYFLLEYRDEEITLQYQRDDEEKFSLPPNLYIIGTMNTADRSIALVDLALRRRFYFVEFHPDEEPVKGVLRRWLESNHPEMTWVADVVEEANKLLETDRHAAIGPSYFMKDELDKDMVERIWKHSVLPYIEERRFGRDEEIEEFNFDKLRKAVMDEGGSPGGEGGEENPGGDSGNA